MIQTDYKTAEIYSLAGSVDYAAGAIVSKIILKKDTGNLTLFAFEKGQGLSEHTAPFDALVQVVEGSAEILIDGKSYIVETGNFIIMPAHVPHAVNAHERFKMLLIMIKGNNL